MSDMKCPFCGDEMKLTSLYMDGNHRYSHKYIGGLSGGKDRCPFDGETLPLRALQEIHRTRKKLDIAMDGLKRIEKLTEPSYKNRNLEALVLAVNTFSGEIIEQINQRNNNE